MLLEKLLSNRSSLST